MINDHTRRDGSCQILKQISNPGQIPKPLEHLCRNLSLKDLTLNLVIRFLYSHSTLLLLVVVVVLLLVLVVVVLAAEVTHTVSSLLLP